MSTGELASLDARSYVEHLVAFGQKLAPGTTDESAARRAYVERLVVLAGTLSTPPQTSDDALEAFRKTVMPHVDSILRVVAGAQALRRRELGPSARAALDMLGEATDLLGLLGQERDEVMHTRMIATLMGARSHGRTFTFAAECRTALAELLVRRAPHVGAINLEVARVEAELSLGAHGRVDIAVESASDLVFLEAKIDAGERPLQLEDYEKALAARAKGSQRRHLVFLTKDEEHKSASSAAHISISFEDLFLAWLRVALRGPGSRHELRHYLKSIAIHLLRRAAGGGFDTWPVGIQRRSIDLFQKEEI